MRRDEPCGFGFLMAPRLRAGRGAALALGIALALVTLGRPGIAVATAFLPPRPVPSAIAGPADPHPAAAFYNPAALGPLRGVHVYLDGAARLRLGSIARGPSEGVPSPGTAPVTWADPGGFAGVTWDLRTEAFTLGLAVLTPFTDLTRYPLASPVRYHAEAHTSIVFQQTIAAAFRITPRLFVGAAANFAESWLDYRSQRDAALDGGSALVDRPNPLCGGSPCGFENPAAAEDMRLRGFGWGVGFAVGLLARPVDRLWLGLSYTSRIFATGRGDFPLTNDRQTQVAPPPPGSADCRDGQSQGCYHSVVVTAIPDLIHLAARIELTPRIELETSLRWVHYGQRERLDVTLQGNAPTPGTPGTIPAQFFLERGLKDAWAIGVSGRFTVGQKVRLAPSLIFETAAVSAGAVNAANLDAPKLDLTLTTEWRPMKRFRIGAHLGGTAYLLREAGDLFSPRAQVACVDSGYSLDACGASGAGAGLPAARGQYTLFTLHLGASVGLDL